MNRLEVLNIGTKSNHTTDYLVFYLPRARLLFEGDLGYYSWHDSLTSGSRTAGLIEAVESAGLHPERVMQGWPVKRNPMSVSLKELKALVAAAAAAAAAK
jgi:hypothetical protein